MSKTAAGRKKVVAAAQAGVRLPLARLPWTDCARRPFNWKADPKAIVTAAAPSCWSQTSSHAGLSLLRSWLQASAAASAVPDERSSFSHNLRFAGSSNLPDDE